MKHKSKGQFNILAQAGIALIGFILVVATGALVLQQFASTGVVNGDLSNDSASFNNLGEGQEGLEVASEMTPVLAIAIVAMVVIGLFMGWRATR